MPNTPASQKKTATERFSSAQVPYSTLDELTKPLVPLGALLTKTAGLISTKEMGEAVFSAALLFPGLVQDAASAASIITGKSITIEKVGGQAAALIEKTGHLPVEELARQAISSIVQTAHEVQDGTMFSRDPITPAIHLFAAEYVIAMRGVDDKVLFLETMMESCALLLENFPGKDVKGMLMARMLWEATDGIVAQSLKADTAKGMKTEHTVDQAIQALNKTVQKHSDELIAGLGTYVSTSVVPVFGVSKSDAQIRTANELLFANRNIATQKVFLEGADPNSIVRSIMAGFEFIEGDEETLINNRIKLAEAKRILEEMRKACDLLKLVDPNKLKQVVDAEKHLQLEAEMQRLNMDAIVVAISPALFMEEVGLAENGRGHNRTMVKAEKYGDGGAGNITDKDTAVTAFAKTGKFYPVGQKMKGKMVTISPGTAKSKHGGVHPDVFLKIMHQATAPNENARSVIGNMTKLIDKMGPRNEEFGLATIPLSATEAELAIILEAVKRKGASGAVLPNKIIDRSQLKPMAEAMAKTTNLILGEMLAEIQAKAGRREKCDETQFADDDPAYTAKLVYRLGRLLETSFVGNNIPAVGEVATGFNNFLIDVYTGRLEVSPEVDAATRMVFEISFAQYPKAVQKDFLKKLITRGITDPEKMNRWFDILYPVAVREQSYIPEEAHEVFGVRTGQAKDILLLTRQLVDVFPDMGETPKDLMAHVLEGDDTFIAAALRLTWAVGNKLRTPQIMFVDDTHASKKLGDGGEKRKLLKDLNTNIDTLRQMIIARLEREFAYEMRAKSPLAMFGNIEHVLGLAEGLTSQIVNVQAQFMQAFSRTCGLFNEDVLVVDNADKPGMVRMVTIPQSASSAAAIIDISTGQTALDKVQTIRKFMMNEEKTGELDVLLNRAEAQVDDRGDLAGEILSKAFAEGEVRDIVLAEAAGEMLGKILGIPQDVQGAEPTTGEKAPKTSSRLRSLYTLWSGGYGSYGKSIALMAILTANQQALGQGANSVASIIETLARAEKDGLKASVDLFRETGEVGLHKSVAKIGEELSTFTMGQVKNAEDVDKIRGEVLTAVAEQAKSRLARLDELENQLARLHVSNNQLEIDVIRQQIALRRTAIEKNAKYAQKELAEALNSIYKEREQLVQTMKGIRAAAVENRIEILKFLGDVFDPNGDYQTKRIKLMQYIRKYTGADVYGIAMPTEDTIFALVGINEAERKVLMENRGKKSIN